MRAWAFAAALLIVSSLPTMALSEADLVKRYCKGMITEFTNPDGTRTDCISDTHAIEVDFSEKWAESIGQALHYSLWTREFSRHPDDFARWHYQVKTPRRAGIILICRENRRTETCANHVVRPKRIAEEYGIPLTIWDCNPDTDMALDECLRLDIDPELRPHKPTNLSGQARLEQDLENRRCPARSNCFYLDAAA